MSIGENFQKVNERIVAAAKRVGRDPRDIKLVAVSKTIPVERIQEGVAAGIKILGENRVQEAGEKAPFLLGQGLEWHLVGHLQTNKAKQAVSLFDWIHSVDSLRLAETLEKEAGKIGKKLNCLLEINIGGEESKFGVKPADAETLLKQISIFPHLKVQGLMTVAPIVPTDGEARPYFRRMTELRKDLESRSGLALPFLSMGMTDDFEVAIEEGAKLVRIGRALFGERT